MAILILTSAGGSPGVTTLAVGLALTWPRPVLLADCDPGAHQAVLAGYLAGQSPAARGCCGSPRRTATGARCARWSIDQSPAARRRGRRPAGCSCPASPSPAARRTSAAVWADLAEAFDRLGDVDIDVIVDAGRIGPPGCPAPLVERGAPDRRSCSAPTCGR